MTREQLEDALDCPNITCDNCLVNTEPGNCMPRVARAAIKLMYKLERAEQKLERAKEVMRELECCKTCANHERIDKNPCIACLESIEWTPNWEFNEDLLKRGK